MDVFIHRVCLASRQNEFVKQTSSWRVQANRRPGLSKAGSDGGKKKELKQHKSPPRGNNTFHTNEFCQVLRKEHGIVIIPLVLRPSTVNYDKEHRPSTTSSPNKIEFALISTFLCRSLPLFLPGSNSSIRNKATCSSSSGVGIFKR